MEISHRVGFNADMQPDSVKLLGELKIQYKITPLPAHEIGLVYFDIFESDSRWPFVHQIIKERSWSNVYESIFNRKEVVSASWNRLKIVYEKGYPQPENSWMKSTYERVCNDCGVDGRQIFPYQIDREPKVGVNTFSTLFWTYELFSKKEVYPVLQEENVEGIVPWDVFIHKTKEVSDVIQQLYVINISKSKMVDDQSLGRNVCQNCGRTKFMPHKRGYMKFNEIPSSKFDIVLSNEWFGDVRSAYQEILVSNKFTRLILEKKWKGVKFKPLNIIGM